LLERRCVDQAREALGRRLVEQWVVALALRYEPLELRTLQRVATTHFGEQGSAARRWGVEERVNNRLELLSLVRRERIGHETLPKFGGVRPRVTSSCRVSPGHLVKPIRETADHPGGAPT